MRARPLARGQTRRTSTGSQVAGGRVANSPSNQEQLYQQELCDEYAKLAGPSLLQGDFCFLEIFSGLVASLSLAVSRFFHRDGTAPIIEQPLKQPHTDSENPLVRVGTWGATLVRASLRRS